MSSAAWGDRLAAVLHGGRRLLRAYGLLLPLLLLLVYFVYHGIHGPRGLFAWLDLRREVALVRSQLAELEAERRRLQRRVDALRPGQTDADLAESELRRLGYVGRDEFILLDESDEKGPGD